MDLPGMTKENISIDVKDNHLIISAERTSEEKSEKQTFVRLERSYGKFSRSLTLPEDANMEQVRASYNHGVLQLDVPKREPRTAPRRTIEIQ
jgi:HSP20 family protein